jgi:hypothetical protein
MLEMSRRDPGNNRQEMMLVISKHRGGDVTLFMALPDGATRYEGFEPAQLSDIPPNPSLLVGDQIGYDELFVKGGPSA